MTTVYFVRHAEPNYKNHDDPTRELTAKGVEDCNLVTRFFADKKVDAVLSSPYRRARDTVHGVAEAAGLEILVEDDFRERKADGGWIEDFSSFCRRQWADFDYKLSDGETLREVQERNIAALSRVLREHRDQTIVIGTHGTALSTIIHFYDRRFGYADFERIKGLMPWIVKFSFQGDECLGIEPYDVFAPRG